MQPLNIQRSLNPKKGKGEVAPLSIPDDMAHWSPRDTISEEMVRGPFNT